MKRTSGIKVVFVALAVAALAAVPCAWDSRDIHDASWLPAIASLLSGAAN
ncbi:MULTISPECIES: hypothetical protein [unclassified Bosea (in: a-proteobacteria)]|nr:MULTISPECIES: hypothetical protein [unclassified Bosea (in: a-proteobacteria)]SIQ24542.1 hypothetical protein SAMN05880592_102138 [Bosea sp. TND4EK4]